MSETELLYLSSCGCSKAIHHLDEEYRTYLMYIARKYYNMYRSVFNDISEVHYLVIQGYAEAKATYNIRSNASLKTHITNRTKYMILNYFRKFDRTGRHFKVTPSLSLLEEDGKIEYLSPIADKRISALSSIMVNELRETSHSKLSKIEVEIFQKYLDGFSYSEIAKSINLTTKQVDNKIQRIKSLVKGPSKIDYFGLI